MKHTDTERMRWMQKMKVNAEYEHYMTRRWSVSLPRARNDIPTWEADTLAKVIDRAMNNPKTPDWT